MKGFWRKCGLIYCPPDEPAHPKLATHAANPVAHLLGEDVFRVYFNGRDAQQRSSIGAVDVDLRSGRVVQKFDTPLFAHGPEGSFYSNGISLGNICRINEENSLLFMGWEATPDGRWRGSIGRLTIYPDSTLRLDHPGPLLTTDGTDPVSLSYPWGLEQPGKNILMWYGTTHSWNAGNGEMLHVIHASSSSDGENWTRHGQVLEHRIGTSQAFSRPSIVRNKDGTMEMWVSFRGGPTDAYRIGYARSENGKSWDWRPDEAGISASPSGWDSEMIEYPFVFEHRGERWMLYNGNGYGRTGFGLALWEPN